MYYNRYIKYKKKYSFLKSSMRSSMKGGSDTHINTQKDKLYTMLNDLHTEIMWWGGRGEINNSFDLFNTLLDKVNALILQYNGMYDDTQYNALLMRSSGTLLNIIKTLELQKLPSDIDYLKQKLSEYSDTIKTFKIEFKAYWYDKIKRIGKSDFNQLSDIEKRLYYDTLTDDERTAVYNAFSADEKTRYPYYKPFQK